VIAAYALAGLLVAVGMSVGAYVVAGEPLSDPATPIRVAPLAPAPAETAPAPTAPPRTATAPPRTATRTGEDDGSTAPATDDRSGGGGGDDDGGGSGRGRGRGRGGDDD
jgi:hypothetical protein